jgi:hypothetical protein
MLHALIEGDPDAPFVAIDFETADYGPDSACAVALVRVEDGCIVSRRFALIRPPRRSFRFTGIHGITWNDVAGEPTFAECWPALSGVLGGAHFLAAHNSAFDRGVLRACCRRAGIDPPAHPFLCSVRWHGRPGSFGGQVCPPSVPILTSRSIITTLDPTLRRAPGSSSKPHGIFSAKWSDPV